MLLNTCQCGCGQETKLATYSDPRWGTVKGQPTRFIQGHGGHFKHRQTGKNWQSPVYRKWSNMVQRCTNPNNPRTADYLERDPAPIDMDPRFCDFSAYLAVVSKLKNAPADLARPRNEAGEKLTIDRIDNDKGYWEWNLRWATYKQQNNNRRSRYRDKTHCDRGHPLSGDNLFVRKLHGEIKGRGCRACARERTRQHQLKQRANRSTTQDGTEQH